MQEIAQIEETLNQAREDLYQTIRQLSRKATAPLPSPDGMIRRNPLLWVGGALVVGSLAGLDSRNGIGPLRFILFGGLVGAAVAKITNEFKRKD